MLLLHSSWTDDGDNNCIQIPTNWCLVCLVTCWSIHKSDFVHVTQSATPSMSTDQKCNSHRCNVQNNNNNNNYNIFTGQWLVVWAPCVGISKLHNRTLKGLTKLQSITIQLSITVLMMSQQQDTLVDNGRCMWGEYCNRHCIQLAVLSRPCMSPNHITSQLKWNLLLSLSPGQCVVVRAIVLRWYVHSIALTQWSIPLPSPIESEIIWTGFV